MTELYLAADGGNSKTDVVLGDGTGRVLAFVRGGTSSPHNIGLDGTVAVLDALIRAAHEQAGVPFGTRVEAVAVYLAGADLPVEVAQLSAAVSDAAWAARALVDNDCFAMLRAGTASPDAVVVVCGAGNNCVGRTADGRTARFPALGPISGDWGGGHDLAEHALRYAARGEDGRGTPTRLSSAVSGYFGLPTVEAVSIALHLGDIPLDRVRELTPVLFEVAAAGDLVASELVTRQADEILAQHRVAAARLDLLDKPHDLVLGGGVLQARHAQLHDQVVAGARAQAPKVEIKMLDAPPVVGAALLALDALGMSSAVEPVVRDALLQRRVNTSTSATAASTMAATSGNTPPTGA
ncbi:ATPase [Actinoplanes sp. TBRC 11911]|uniref:N-acetylglucosamine kinase n=1 Tax=Actinoplanes sp. TBRC 11911 TaxID=2729386 RepID=UPI00145ECFAB|nr:BadF/BadG/BcrA/BcrD ATPase family protein [Actinoplanes sp. TBRC 11911]NMO52132.1 ATPase [Actinoplanes sp. TBRC 11911]